MTSTNKSDLSISQFKSYFDVGDHTIVFVGSTLNGLEQVYVDDQLVSEKRSFGLKSDHHFRMDGSAFSIHVALESLLKGRLSVQLYHGATRIDGDVIDILKLALKNPGPRYGIILTMVLGAIVGYLVGFFLISGQ